MIRRLLLLLALSTAAACAVPFGGGGRDVSVAIFSTRTLQAVTISPAGPDAWTARCARCAHMPLTAPVRVRAGEIFAGGAVRITNDETNESRAATGLWHLRRTVSGLDVVLVLPSERYVEAVLNAEAGPGEKAESLRALAIVVRTYALNGRHYSAGPGHLAADLCDSTECQAMRLGPVSQAVSDAVVATTGETLWSGAARAEAFFSQNCGGVTEDAGAVWPRLSGAPYLRSHPDAHCARSGGAAWHAELALADLARIARSEGWRLPEKIVTARVRTRTASHRALRIAFSGEDEATAEVSANALRFGIGRALGWNRVRSDAYEIAVRNGTLVFDGRGYGHGVGLCQAGAAEMAVEGKTAREILAFYFPGTAVRITPRDNGWEESRVGGLAVGSVREPSVAERDGIARAWAEAQRRFKPRAAVAARIRFAPTTELFRQMTAEPGWALASTRSGQIVLQPEDVLQRNRISAWTLLMHEMLHVLVEQECTARTPLWLREGLVEVLAGDVAARVEEMSSAAVESALRHAGSLAEAQKAHRAAAGRVRLLIERYGVSVVRGWLGSSVPPSVD